MPGNQPRGQLFRPGKIYLTGSASSNSKCRPKECQALRRRVLPDRILPVQAHLLRANRFIKAGFVLASQFRSAQARQVALVVAAVIKAARQAATAGPVVVAAAPCSAVVRTRPLQAAVDRQVLRSNRRFYRFLPTNAAPMQPSAGMIRAVIGNRSAKAS